MACICLPSFILYVCDPRCGADRVLTEEPPVWADTKLLNKKEAEPGSANASAAAAAAAAASATATTTDQGE